MSQFVTRLYVAQGLFGCNHLKENWFHCRTLILMPFALRLCQCINNKIYARTNLGHLEDS